MSNAFAGYGRGEREHPNQAMCDLTGDEMVVAILAMTILVEHGEADRAIIAAWLGGEGEYERIVELLREIGRASYADVRQRVAERTRDS